jgi:sugar phosphate isomerase/epimerase
LTIKISAYPKCYEYEIGLYRRMTVFDWISMAEGQLDVAGLEMYDRFLTSLEPDYLMRVRKAANKAGFVIPMMICAPDFTHPDPEERQKAIDYQKRMIQTAAILGGEGVICRTLSGQKRPQVSREQGVRWVIDCIQQVIPVAKRHGVVLGMENHYKDSQWTLPEFALKQDVFLEIVHSIDERKHFGVQYDPSNAIVAGDDPIVLLKNVKDRVVSMHASDRHWKPGVDPEQIRKADTTFGYAQHLCHGIIGQGLNDYDKIFSILSESGFHGWVSVEDGVNGLDEIKESVRFLQLMRDKYYGK